VAPVSAGVASSWPANVISSLFPLSPIPGSATPPGFDVV
jgi:hypothetical protein